MQTNSYFRYQYEKEGLIDKGELVCCFHVGLHDLAIRASAGLVARLFLRTKPTHTSFPASRPAGLFTVNHYISWSAGRSFLPSSTVLYPFSSELYTMHSGQIELARELWVPYCRWKNAVWIYFCFESCTNYCPAGPHQEQPKGLFLFLLLSWIPSCFPPETNVSEQGHSSCIFECLGFTYLFILFPIARVYACS